MTFVLGFCKAHVSKSYACAHKDGISREDRGRGQ